MSDTNTSKNVGVVKAIGAGERKLGETADTLVSENSDSFTDKKLASAEATRLVWEFVGGQDGAPAQRDRNKQPTDFGRGFGSLQSAVKNRLLAKGATDWLELVRVSVKNAVNHEIDPNAIMEAVEDLLMVPDEITEAA